MIDLPKPLRRRLSRRLVRAASARPRGGLMSVQQLIDTLGDRSFGWCILVFALVNMVPTPIGTNMVTSIPLILLAGQMALGYRQVRLPAFVTRREIDRRGFQRLVLRFGPVIRPIERMVRPRLPALFTARQEQLLGMFLLLVALSLFAPIPLSGFIPATALFVTGFGLVERDGVVLIAGVALGVVAVLVTLVVGSALLAGVQALAH